MLGDVWFDDADGQDDSELCRLCRQGDENAFRVIASRYCILLKKNASRYSESADDSDDLLQEGLIALHDAAMTFDENAGAAFRTYAGVCVRNRMISAVRHQQAMKKRSMAAASIEEAENVPSSPESDPLHAVIMSEELEHFYAFLREKLSSSEEKVLDLYLEGLSFEEIAQRLGVSRKSCDNAMQRVRKKLRCLRR
ncbi:MAG: sigma-70 family RNA polymerase sigma factor [Clostridia bacterium]|nr:sigma-70 family RNA polymerase sigma factor [Clostridia bacterium]